MGRLPFRFRNHLSAAEEEETGGVQAAPPVNPLREVAEKIAGGDTEYIFQETTWRFEWRGREKPLVYYYRKSGWERLNPGWSLYFGGNFNPEKYVRLSLKERRMIYLLPLLAAIHTGDLQHLRCGMLIGHS
jgi:hypothetical protein